MILGIARGLVYLHQDSRLRVIHGDLNISSIILDHNMNPRISDFDVARSMAESQTERESSGIEATQYVIHYPLLPLSFSLSDNFFLCVCVCVQWLYASRILFAWDGFSQIGCV